MGLLWIFESSEAEAVKLVRRGKSSELRAGTFRLDPEITPDFWMRQHAA